MNKMKVGVIGCGRISDVYYENMIHKFEILHVSACAAKHLAHAKEKAEKLGILALTVEELLADDEIEMIVNLTPAPAHYELIKQCLEAGKHVFTEKIVTTTLDEALQLKALAENRKLRLGCAPDTFLGAAIQTAKHAVDQGMIGEAVSCHAAVNRELGFALTPNGFMSIPGGGIGFDVGIYYLTALLCILGPVEAVSGFTANTCPERVIEDPKSPDFGKHFSVDNENVMVASLKFKNGVYGTLNFNSNSIWPQNPILTIYGTHGIIHMANPDKFSGKVILQKRGDAVGIELPVSYGFTENARGVEAAEMAWAIRQNRPHRADFNMGCHALEVFEGVVTSGETGQMHKMTTAFEKPAALPEGYVDGYYNKSRERALME